MPANKKEEPKKFKRKFYFLDSKGNKVKKYLGTTPQGAAKKAFNDNFPVGTTNKKFSIVETTRGSKGKQYDYVGSIKKVNKSYTVKSADGKESKINITKETEVKKAK